MYKTVDFYLPHRSPMLLLDRVILVEDERCVCQTDINEHSSVAAFIENGQLDNVFTVEIMAQCIGVWSGFHQRQGGAEQIKNGMLVAIRDAKFSQAFVTSNQSLTTEVKLLLIDNNFGCFDCKVKVQDELIATATISTYQIDS